MATTLKQGSTFYSPQTGKAQGTVQYDSKTGAKLATGGSTTISPAIITSKAATRDLQNIKNNVMTVTTDMQTQAQKIANDKAVADANAKLKAEQDTKAKLEADKAAADKITADAKLAATTGVTPPAKTADELAIDKARAEDEKLSKQRLDEAQTTFDKITGIQNGSIPLDAGENAQIEGLKQQFQTLIQEQKLTNTGATGTAQVRGYQTGAAEYDPTFQIKTIAPIITAGLNKVADLNIKMASAVASLTQAFKDNKIAGIKEAYNLLNDAKKERQTTIEKTIKDTQDIIKEAQAKKQKITDDINAILTKVAEQNAPKEIKDAVTKATSVAEAISAAGDYLQTSTNADIAKYLQYKRDTLAKGLVPKDYDTYQAEQDAKAAKVKSSEAYATAYSTAKGKADAELAAEGGAASGAFAATIDQVANLEPTVAGKKAIKGQLTSLIKNEDYGSAYNQIANTVENGLVGESKQRFANARTDLKVMEGLKDAVKKFTDAGGDTNLLKGKAEEINRKLLGVTDSPELTRLAVQLQREFQTYRNTMTGAAFSPEESREYASVNPSSTNNLDLNLDIIQGARNQLKNRVESTINSRVPSAQYINEFAHPKEVIDDYIVSHPNEAETVAKLYELPGWTDLNVLEYLSKLQ